MGREVRECPDCGWTIYSENGMVAGFDVPEVKRNDLVVAGEACDACKRYMASLKPYRVAPVQGSHWSCRTSGPGRSPGTISWAEHEEAWLGYAEKFGSSQSAERIAERGGFSYEELVMFLGHEPKTWSLL